MTKAKFKVYSDSASFNNGFKQGKDIPQICTIGIAITHDEKLLYKGVKSFEGEHATISFGELTGAITVLDMLNKKIDKINENGVKIHTPYQVELFSDSQFVIKGINEWMKGWIKRGWKNAAGQVVGQVDLFKDIKKRYLDNDDWDITFTHVKGHTGKTDFESEMNDLCDKIASKKLKDIKKELDL